VKIVDVSLDFGMCRFGGLTFYEADEGLRGLELPSITTELTDLVNRLTVSANELLDLKLNVSTVDVPALILSLQEIINRTVTIKNTKVGL